MRHKTILTNRDYVANIAMVMDNVLDAIETEFLLLQEEIKTFPEGKLRVRTRDGKTYFSILKDGKEYGMTKNSELVTEFIRKEYVLARSADLSESRVLMDGAKKKLDAVKQSTDLSNKHAVFEPGIPATGRAGKILKKFSKFGFNVKQIAVFPDVYAWINQEFSFNGTHPDAKQYKTNGGVSVRSKSEMLIGSFLEEKGINYNYEPIIEIYGRRYAPDFLIRLADGREIIWEHFGLTDDAGYAMRAFEKLQLYTEAGFILGINMIATFESDIKAGNIETIINDIVIG